MTHEQMRQLCWIQAMSGALSALDAYLKHATIHSPAENAAREADEMLAEFDKRFSAKTEAVGDRRSFGTCLLRFMDQRCEPCHSCRNHSNWQLKETP